MNPHIRNRLESIRQVLMACYSGGKGLPSALKGRERETFIDEFLAKTFPPIFRFGTGTITDSYYKVTGQIDIVMELPFGPSFPLPIAPSSRLYPVESVGAVIEVKSDLSKKWDEAMKTIAKVKALKRIIPCYAVGYKGHKRVKTLEKKFLSINEKERPDGVLIIDSDYFYSEIYKGDMGLFFLVSHMQRKLQEQFSSEQADKSNILNYLSV